MLSQSLVAAPLPPVGGVATAQTQRGYVGPLVSECSLQLEVCEAHSSGHYRKILDKQTG